MKRAVSAIALAGIAMSAPAQDFSLSLVPVTATIECAPGSFDIEVYGDATVGTHMLGGGFGLQSNSSSIADMTWTPASWSLFNTDGGYAGNGNYNTVIFGQIIIGIPPFDVPPPESALGSLIGTFTVSIVDPQPEIMQFDLIGLSPFSLEVVDVNTRETFRSSDGNLILNGTSILLCPSPSAIALFSLSGLVATGRRR